MLKYFALSWVAESRSSGALSQIVRQRFLTSQTTCTIAVDIPGLFVAYISANGSAADVVVLPDDRGVLVGTIFRRQATATSCARPLVLSESELHRVVLTRGRSVIKEFWGSYVLLLADVPRRCVDILRAPMGTLQCFYTGIGDGVTAIFSSVDDLHHLRIIALSINWEVIGAQASNRDYLTNETALREITSLECGECLHLQCDSYSHSTDTYWSPCDIARLGEIDDLNEATSQLRATTQSCIAAWAALHSTVVLSLSGGIDSSIVLACLAAARTKPNVTCLTQYSTQAVGDERRFARSMAERMHVTLLEIQRDPEVNLARILECVRTARPVLHYTGCDSYPTTLRVARSVGATAIFDGELGDNVFGRFPAHEPVAEYTRRYGLRLALLPIAMDFAYLKNLSIWQVLWRGFRDGVVHGHESYWSMNDYMRRFLGKDPTARCFTTEATLQSYEHNLVKFIHPWNRDIERVPLGRFMMIQGAIVRTSTAYQQPFAQFSDPPVLSPLASQPLIECCLRIPSQFHIRGGTDRAVARRAFEDDLSTLVLTRSGKGSPEGWISETTKKNRAFLKELLLEGILVKERILDKKKLEYVLSEDVSNSLLSEPELIVYAFIEAWLRLWSPVRVCAVA